MEPLFYQGRQFEQMAALSNVPTLGAPQGFVLARGFMDMPAKEIPRLFAFDKLADCFAAKMFSFSRAIESGAFRWRVADQHQRIKARKFVEALLQFLFAILAWRVEGRGVRVAEACDVVARDFHRPAVKIVKSKLVAKPRDIGFRFVVSRQHIHVFGPFLKNRPHVLEATPKIGEVSGREIVVRIDGHEFFKRSFVAVNIGEDEQLHLNEGSRRKPLRQGPGSTMSRFGYVAVRLTRSRRAAHSRLRFG